MSKVIFVTHRVPANVEQQCLRACRRLNPRGFQVSLGSRFARAIINPHETLTIEGESVLCGYSTETKWDELGVETDGSFAIFRVEGDHLELLTDIAATRSIWLYKDDNLFVAATTQRGIQTFLTQLDFNRSAIAWMLSSGSLGPGQSWNSKVQLVPPDTCVHFDASKWQLDIGPSNPVTFGSACRTEANLEASLASTFSKFELNFNHWHLPISGGYDSRAILHFLSGKICNPLITWGLKSALNNKFSDGFIGKELASAYRMPFVYINTDELEDDHLSLLDEFITAGEGRVDHFEGFNIQIWKKLGQLGIQGMIRGDEGFGWLPTSIPQDSLLVNGLLRFNDFQNLAHLQDDYPAQIIPEYLERKENDSIEDWRDRIYHLFRIPTVLSALTDLKCPYMEVINPLISKELFSTIRGMPSTSRTNKKAFKRIVKSLTRSVPFAKSDATQSTLQSQSKLDLLRCLRSALESSGTEKLFPRILLDQTLQDLSNPKQLLATGPNQLAILKSYLKEFAPKSVKSWVRKKLNKPKIPAESLAFRMFIVARMYTYLLEDTGAAHRE